MKAGKRRLKNSFFFNVLFCSSPIYPADTLRNLPHHLYNRLNTFQLPNIITTYPMLAAFAGIAATITTYFGIKHFITAYEPTPQLALEQALQCYVAEWHNYTILHDAASSFISENLKRSLEASPFYKLMPLIDHKKISHALADGGHHIITIENWDPENSFDASFSIAHHTLTGVTLLHSITKHPVNYQHDNTELLTSATLLWKIRREQKMANRAWVPSSSQNSLTSRFLSWLRKNEAHAKFEEAQKQEAQLFDCITEACEDRLCRGKLAEHPICTQGARCIAGILSAAYKEYNYQLAHGGKPFAKEMFRNNVAPDDKPSFFAHKTLYEALEHAKLTLKELKQLAEKSKKIKTT